MEQALNLNGQSYKWDLNHFYSIAIPFKTGENHVNAWYANPIEKKPYQSGNFIGSIEAGASVNFFDLKINPHGNGTHTECLGHISANHESIKDVDIKPLIVSQLLSLTPQMESGDKIITKKQLENLEPETKALIIRTLPNSTEKISYQYSGSNPPYLVEEAAQFLHDIGIEHLLIDTPSVDKENDEGKLLAHKAFWGFNSEKKYHRTITEMIFVPDEIKDGLFLLNLQFLPLENDASPSNPVIFPLTKLS